MKSMEYDFSVSIYILFRSRSDIFGYFLNHFYA